MRSHNTKRDCEWECRCVRVSVCLCVCVSSRCNRLERNANDSNVVPKMGTLSTLRVQRATNKQLDRLTDRQTDRQTVRQPVCIAYCTWLSVRSDNLDSYETTHTHTHGQTYKSCQSQLMFEHESSACSSALAR